MSIGAAVFQQLRATPAVLAACRWIYPHVIPQDREPPAITYREDFIERDRLLSGQGSYNTAQVSIDVYTLDYLQSNTISDVIEAALVDYRGVLGNASTLIDCDHIRLERRNEIFESVSSLYRVSLQFTIGYQIG